MKEAAWIDPRRAGILVVAASAIGLCFIPLGRVPSVGSLRDIQLARIVAVGVFVLIASLLLVGRRRKMHMPVQVVAGIATVAIIGFCVFRIGVLGKRAMPVFDDDDPRAGLYYQKACDNQVMEACAMLGTCYWTGACGVPKSSSRGFELFEKACNGGEMGACGQLGVCYEFGGCGLVKSGERAIAYYERACDGGEASMCNNLGVCYHKGECGVAKNDERAAQLYRQACRGGDAGGCHNLDLMKN